MVGVGGDGGLGLAEGGPIGLTEEGGAKLGGGVGRSCVSGAGWCVSKG